MPRKRQPAPRDKLIRCIDALLANPDAACMGGTETCCGGCGSGGGELVESLSAFLLHGDVARRAFVARGGLESLHVLVSKALGSAGLENSAGPGRDRAGPGPGSDTYAQQEDAYGDGEEEQSSGYEVRALGALVLVQALTSSAAGQSLLLQRCPELLQSVCQLARSEDEESEGLKQAALRLLGGWHDEVQIHESGDLIARWLATSGGGAPLRRRAGSEEGEEMTSTSMVSIAMSAVAHPMLSVRRAAAQLFAVAATYLTSRTSLASSPLSHTHADHEPSVLLSQLCVEVGQIVSDSTSQGLAAAAPASLPAVQAALLSPRGGPMTAAFLLRQQEEIHMRRQKVQGLVEIACALVEEAPSSTVEPGVADAHSSLVDSNERPLAWWYCTPMVGTLLRVFSAAWGLPEPQIGFLRGIPGEGVHDSTGVDPLSPPSPSSAAPFVFTTDPDALERARRNQRLAAMLLDQSSGGPPHTVLQDHQMREHSLDALILLLRNRSGLESLIPCSPVPTGSNRGLLVGAFHLIQGLVLALLQREAPAHVRAGLALLGGIQWCLSRTLSGHEEDAPQKPLELSEEDNVSALAQLLSILCDVFDCGWEAEGMPLEALLPCKSGIQANPFSTGNSPSSEPSSGPIFVAAQTPLLSPTRTSASPPLAWSGPSNPQKPLLKVEVGLGHRVLVQVLQAWKRLGESGGPGVAVALGRTQWWPRVVMARMHERRLVVSAASQINPLPVAMRDGPLTSPGAVADGDMLGEADALAENLGLLKVFDEPLEVLWSNGVVRGGPLPLGEPFRGGVAGAPVGLGQVIGLNPVNGPFHQSTRVAEVPSGDPIGLLPSAGMGDGLMETDEEMIQFLKEVLLDGDLEDEGKEGSLREGDVMVSAQPGSAECEIKEDEYFFAEDPSSLIMFEPFLGGSLLDLASINGGPQNLDAPSQHLYPDSSGSSRRSRSKMPPHAVELLPKEVEGSHERAPQSIKTETEMLSEAMELLPDLDAVAEQLCVKYDIVDLPYGKGLV